MIRYRLLQARNPDDVVRTEERAAFASQLGVSVEQVIPHDLLSTRTNLDAVVDGVDAVLVGGSGHYSVYDDAPWIPAFIDTLGALAKADFPTFASCFGFQALVMALGHPVQKDDDAAEVGTYGIELLDPAADDALFAHLPSRFLAQLGHKDRAMSLPEDAVLLARSERCPYQAIRVGRRVWATQFHPELTGAENRARFMRYYEDYSKAFGAATAEALLESFQHSPEADTLLARFHTLVSNGH